MKLTAFLAEGGRARAAGAVVLGAAAGLANAALAAVVGSALASERSADVAVLFLFVSVGLLGTALRLTSQATLIHMAHASMRRLRLSVSRRIVATPLARLERLGGARLLAALTEDAAAVADGVQAFPFWCVNLATVVGCIVYLAWLSPSTTLWVLAVLGVGVFAYRWIERRALARMTASREHHDRLVEQFRALTDGAKELQMHRSRRESFLTDSLEPIARAVERNSAASMISFAWGGAWAQLVLLALLATAMTWAGGGAGGYNGHRAAYCVAVLFLLRPVDFVLQLWPLVRRAGVSLEKLSRLELSGEPASPRPAGRLAPLVRLELRGVCYAYDADGREEPFQLGPVDLSLQPGQVVFLTGGNGSGKSTLGKILTGLYRPSVGEIHWNGRPLTTDDLEAYGECIGVVFADFFLFERILGGESASLLARWDQLAGRFGLEGFVCRQGDHASPQGLSHGQRRRLALVHALAEDRPIYLFDEWAADQDPHFRRVFYTEIIPELRSQGKLVVAITHDDRFFSTADRIVKLEEGRIVG